LLTWLTLATPLAAVVVSGSDPARPLQPPVARAAPVVPAHQKTTAAEPAEAPPLNYLHTSGAAILDAQNRPVTLTGLNWFGLETGNYAPHGLWARSYGDMLDQIVGAGFNCLRLPFSNELFTTTEPPNGVDFTKNPDLEGMSGLEIMDTVIVAAGTRGLKIILDQHRPDANAQSPLWYTDHLSAEQWLANWELLARRYLGNDAVIGADLHNEPAGPATWGGGDPKTDWATAAETAGNALLAINPDWLILVEGVEKLTDSSGNPLDWTWMGGELMAAKTRPIQLAVPNHLIYSPHDYGPEVSGQHWFSDPTFPDNLKPFWDAHWGYLHQQGVAPILVGEFGGRSVGSDTEGVWQKTLVSYLKENGMHFTYWCLNPNSGDTGGLLEDDWQTINPGKQALLQTYQGKMLTNVAPTVVNRSASPAVSATSVAVTTATPSPTPQPAASPTESPTPLATPSPTETEPATPTTTPPPAAPSIDTEPSTIAAVSPTDVPSASPTPEATSPPNPATPGPSVGVGPWSRTYVVQPGDTLTSIARKMYGDAHLWPRIAGANQELVKDPNLIHPGQKLVIP
jgi:endoglucanase